MLYYADPNAAGFTINLFREFLGEGGELKIPILEPERYNRNADVFFVCEIGETDFSQDPFVTIRKKELITIRGDRKKFGYYMCR